MTIPSSRFIFGMVFFGCCFLMAVALFMEHIMHLEPCPLCILQRIMVITTAITAVIAAIHHPRELGIKIYGGLIIASAATGGGVSIRQLWLQSLPDDEVPACGASLDYMLEVFPLDEVLSIVLTGDGSCAEVLWTFLGISIPGWTLVGFIGLITIGIFQIIRPLRHA
ncbi:MAG: disulfide bond formation protein B [Gammaproteobacteria bacterium]|nr:disulfide bond formation protein B [Gammaproteobacteria bacterium]